MSATASFENLLAAVILAAGGSVRVTAAQLHDGEEAATRLLVDYDPQTGALLLRTTKEIDHAGHQGASGA